MLPYLICTIIVGAVVGIIFKKLRFPAGLMVGALVGVAAFNIFTGWAEVPPAIKITSQIISGAYIGSTISKKDLKALTTIIVPTVFMMLSLLLLNVAIGLVIVKVSPLNLETALMSAVPGGLSEIPVIAADMGADPISVTVMQIGRMFLGIAILPSLILRATKHKKLAEDSEEETNDSAIHPPKSVFRYILTFLCAGAAGVLGSMAHIPGGALVFSLIAILVMNLGFNAGAVPVKSKWVAQVLNGCYVGSLVSLADILFLPQIILPLIILLTLYTFYCLVNGYLMHRLFHFEIRSAFLICIPAGASDMALIASDIGVHNPQVIVMQIARLITVMILFPQIMLLILKFL